MFSFRIGLQMTELLYIWSQLDARVVPLVRAVRHWAEKVGPFSVILLIGSDM